MSTPPKLIAGRYELATLLSGGGMGQVWRGYDTVLDRDIAVKLIKPEIAHSPDRAEFLARFRREARVTAKVEHPGVPAVYDAAFDEDTDRLYIAMQLVHGASLAEMLAEHDGPLPIDWVASVAAQICSVLSYAHSVPVVHRDLKPENVMVDISGAVKVLDFGIAAVLRTDVTRLTSTGRVLGTRPYMSPEQIRNVPVSPSSDLYALGCLLHELLSGSPPFDATDEIALMYQHLQQAPVPLRDLRADVPEALEDLVLDLLAKDPDGRPDSAWDVHDRLLPLLPSPDDTERADLAPVPGALPDPTRPYRRPVAPRPRPAPGTGATVPTPTVLDPAAHPVSPTPALRDEEVAEAYEHALALLDDDRCSQAAEVLADVITAAAEGWGAGSPKVLQLRLTHAAALFLGGDFRRALPELDTLAKVFTRVAGADDERSLDCRRQAAYCRAEMGDYAAAIRELEGVRTLLASRAAGESAEEVLLVRLDIERFRAASDRGARAATSLAVLYEDARGALGPGHPVTTEAGEMLARLRIQGGGSGG